MPIALILAAIAVGTSALGAAASSIPTKADEYRRWRLKQLNTLTKEGLTPDQEEQMRQMGLGSVQAAERETRSRRADALAALSGGATAQDIRAFEASDAERAQKARQAIDTEIIKQDVAAKERYKKEQADLFAQQEGKRKERNAAWMSVLGTAANAAGTVAAAGDRERMEATGPTGASALQQSVGRVYNEQGKIPMPANMPYQSKAVGIWWDGLSPEDQANYAAQFK